MFHENCENSKFHNFLKFFNNPIYIKFSFLKLFALSFEINSKLDRMSPLKQSLLGLISHHVCIYLCVTTIFDLMLEHGKKMLSYSIENGNIS